MWVTSWFLLQNIEIQLEINSIKTFSYGKNHFGSGHFWSVIIIIIIIIIIKSGR